MLIFSFSLLSIALYCFAFWDYKEFHIWSHWHTIHNMAGTAVHPSGRTSEHICRASRLVKTTGYLVKVNFRSLAGRCVFICFQGDFFCITTYIFFLLVTRGYVRDGVLFSTVRTSNPVQPLSVWVIYSTAIAYFSQFNASAISFFFSSSTNLILYIIRNSILYSVVTFDFYFAISDAGRFWHMARGLAPPSTFYRLVLVNFLDQWVYQLPTYIR